MAFNTKVILSRIKSIKNTGKITSAMEKISAVKMRKSVSKVTLSREFTHTASNILQMVSKAGISDPLVNGYKELVEKRELVLLFTSNRGLCGAFNSKVLSQLDRLAANDMSKIDVICVGIKGGRYVKPRYNLIALYDKLPDSPSYDDCLSIASDILSNFHTKKYAKVSMIFTNYISGLKQEVNVKQILPMKLDKSNISADSEEDNSKQADLIAPQYFMEPSQSEIAKFLIPKVVETLIYQAALESSASEHSSRMMAMKSASDSAKDLNEGLTLQFNKARQSAITQEISEIAGTAAALS